MGEIGTDEIRGIMNSSDRYLWSTCYTPCTVLGPGSVAVSYTALTVLRCQLGEIGDKQRKQQDSQYMDGEKHHKQR